VERLTAEVEVSTTMSAQARLDDPGPGAGGLLLRWLLWAWIAASVAAAFLYAPLAKDFMGESSRILFFHVPMAWACFVAFIVAGVWSLFYLGRRSPDHDRAATAAVELGLVFCVLATVSGAMWARIEWGSWWNWDPRQTSITVVLVFYAAYLVLRGAIEDAEARGRLAAVYAVLGLVVAPFFIFVLPRMVSFTLHPEPVINQEAEVKMDARIGWVLAASSLGFNLLFFWVHRLRWRVLRLEAARAGAPLGTASAAAPGGL
jgi:heme exporter protein C